jgi:hypothetical protein
VKQGRTARQPKACFSIFFFDFPASLSNKKRKFSLNKILSSAYHGGSVESRDQSSVHYNHHLKVATGV